MEIIRVRSRSELRSFIRLPARLHHGSPQYIPPLWMEERNNYTSRGNPILANSEFELFLVLDAGGQSIGRAIAYIDWKYNAYYRSRTGFFGSFECANDPEAASALIRTCEAWLRDRGMESVLGPIHPIAEDWGFVLEGGDRDPVYLSPWNPARYHDYFTGAGYAKAKDLLVYEADILKGYRLPDRYAELYDRFMKQYPSLRIRRLDMRRIRVDARAIWEISNVALADNRRYVPLELPVMEDMLRKLRLIVDPDAVWMAEYNGRPVGFCLGFPDINILLKRIGGRLFPIGWIRLLAGGHALRDNRLFGLAIHPDWQGKALDALMYVHLYHHLAPKNVRMEANYILEDNHRIRNSLEKLGMDRIKTYRIYEKPL